MRVRFPFALALAVSGLLPTAARAQEEMDFEIEEKSAAPAAAPSPRSAPEESASANEADRVLADDEVPSRRGKSGAFEGRMQVLGLSLDHQGEAWMVGAGMIFPVNGFGAKPPNLPLDAFLRVLVGQGHEGIDAGIEAFVVAHLAMIPRRPTGRVVALLDAGLDVRRTIGGWFLAGLATFTLRFGDPDDYPGIGVGVQGYYPLASAPGPFALPFLGTQLSLNL